ncbi:uncharacterized protein E0L32_003843 [Thyridium curvatum]|uniref:Uncharacterized protein n=1 Tax=Thyridium curvatum TaxID=1093900 RepID=A0A507BGU8_9PEZI|nr:uncharacterized protein E0L32_003843 [Thyridium curvatum]TPX16549.1 hypothetical protein E0L32_003843 [Thyridium curvatum]
MEAAVGRRVLGEVEEASLDEFLTSFRTTLHALSAGYAAAAAAATAGLEPASAPTRTTTSNNKKLASPFPIPALNELAERHLRATSSPTLSVSGRHLPLLYKLVSTLVARPHAKAVVVIDLEHRFDVSRVLQCSPYREPPPPPPPPADGEGAVQSDVAGATTTSAVEGGGAHAGRPEAAPPLVTLADLQHIHVYRPARSPGTRVADLVAAAEQRMLYGQHGSRRREWWGTIVIGRAAAAAGSGGAGDVAVEAGWRGWLQVAAAQEATSFGSCLSLEEGLLERERGRRRRAAGRQQTWVASSVWGGFEFTES